MTKSTSHHDAVIVGARAAGAATAMLLARAGLDVVVVDRGRYGADTLSTHALMRAGVIQLRRWGLLDDVVAAGTPPVRNTTFVYADDELSIPVKAAHGVDALYAPRRTILDPLLVDAAWAAGAQIHHATSLTELTRDSTGRVNGIRARTHAGETLARTARWVIGADGLRSAVAAGVGAPTEHRGTATTAAIYGYFSDIDVDGYRWIFRPDACAGAIPTNDGLTCVFAIATPGRIGKGGQEAFEQVLQAASPELAAAATPARRHGALRTFLGAPGYVRHPWGPGWALVGDSGYWKDPISAHGLTDALRDAGLLATALIDAASGADEADALSHYHRRRNDLSLPLFHVTDEVAAMAWTDAEIPGLLMQLSTAMTDEIEAVANDDVALTGGTR